MTVAFNTRERDGRGEKYATMRRGMQHSSPSCTLLVYVCRGGEGGEVSVGEVVDNVFEV